MPAFKSKELQRFIFDSFGQGMVTRIAPERIDKSAFADSQNIALNDKFVPTKALGQKIYDSTFTGTTPVMGAFIYTASDGTKYYVKATGGKIYYSIAGSGTYTAYQVRVNGSMVDMTINSTSQVEFAQYNNKLYVVNGMYPIITNDNSSDHAFTISKLIVISGTSVNGITDAQAPAGLQYIRVDKERLFGLNSIAQAGGLFWTNTFFDYSLSTQIATAVDASLLASIWVPASGLNYDYVGKDDGEIGCAIFPFNNSLYVFKETNVYQYSTIGDITNWGHVRLDTRYGCPFNRTVQDLDGYMYWLSLEGMVRCDGTNCELVDDNIRNRLMGISGLQAIPQMSSRSRQWTQGQSSDFQAGTFNSDLIDITDSEIKQTSQQAIFPSGTFGAKVINVPNVLGLSGFNQYIITLLSQSLAADWNAGTFSGTVVNGNTVQLDTQNIQVPTPTAKTGISSGNPVNQFWTTFDLGAVRMVNHIYSPSAKTGNWWFSNDNSTWVQAIGNVQANGGAYQASPYIYRYWQYRDTFIASVYTAFWFDPNYSWGYIATITQHTVYDLGTDIIALSDFTVTGISSTSLTGTWYYSDDGTTWVAGSTGVHRYWKFIQTSKTYTDATYGYGLFNAHAYVRNLPNNGGDSSAWPFPSITFTYSYNIYINISQTVYLSSGTFVTQTLDLGSTPQSMGILVPAYKADAIYTSVAPGYIPLGTGLLFETRTSDDGNTWQSWTAVDFSTQKINSAIKRYLQIRTTFYSSDTSRTPILNSIIVSAPFISKIIDCGASPITFGTFVADVTANNGSVTFYTRSSDNSNMSSPTSWTTIISGSAIASTLKRYFQWCAVLNPGNDGSIPQINGIYIAARWDSQVYDIGSAPTSDWVWGNFSAVTAYNSQSLTYWMRTGTSSALCLAASWVQQTPGTPVTSLTLSRYIQVEVRFDMPNSQSSISLPIQEGFNVVWYNTTKIVKPCAYVFNKEYGLNIAGVGSSVNNILWRYTIIKSSYSANFVNPQGFWLYRTNKYNNVYVVDERILISGTSQTDGYSRLNETGYNDDGAPIDSWFITKNVEQGMFKNIFKYAIGSYYASATWTLTFYFSQLTNGQQVTQSLTLSMPPSVLVNVFKRILSGLNLGQLIQIKCEQFSDDPDWQIPEIGYEYDQGYEIYADAVNN
jgi:hypothetical protein